MEQLEKEKIKDDRVKDFIINKDVAASIIKGICQVNDDGKSSDLKEVLRNENLGKNKKHILES